MIRRVLRPDESARRVDEELRHHFERTVEDLVSRGWSRDAADAEARRRFGDVARYRGELTSIDRSVDGRRRWSDRVDVALHSIRYALRSLIRAPALTAGVILAFALGIGANVTMYSVVERLLLRAPDHIVEPDAVKRVYVSAFVPYMSERFSGATLSYPDFRQLASVESFEAAAAYAPRSVTVGSGLGAAEKPAVFVSGNFFDLLGVRPALGRFFTEAEDRVGGPPQVVLSWSVWQRDFGGSADAIGSTIDFGYGAYDVVGVAPKHFTGVDLARVDLWLPFHVVGGAMRGTGWVESRGEEFLGAVVRLRDGATEAGAAAAATAAWVAGRTGTEEEDDMIDVRVEFASVMSARAPDAPPEGMVARLLLIVSAIVLLIAAVNVANLLLARSLKQRREIAVRLALGISRRRLAIQIMLESLILAAVGATVALVLASWGAELITRIMLPDVEWSGALNGRVALVAAGLALMAGVLAGAVPALQAVRGTLSDSLRQAGAGGVTRRTARVRTGLMLAQTGLSALLLVGAGLFVRSLDRVHRTDFGFDPDNLVYAVPRPTSEGIPQEQMREVMERGLITLARVPGVRSVATTRSLPFYAYGTTRVRAEGVDSIPIPETGGPFLNEVSPGYLATMDLALLAGRDFNEQDDRSAQPVALVNASMAAALWPDASPLGRCLYIGVGEGGGPQTRCSEIVGVVEDSRRAEIAETTTLQYYVPNRQQQTGGRNAGLFVLRLSDSAPKTMAAVQRAILDLDPRIRFVEAEPIMNRISPATRSWQVGARILSVFGILALLVASIGLYSALAFDVAQRTRELGVRTALGASRRAVVGLVVAQALRITAAGVTAGLVAALLLAGRVEPLLFETPARDPVTFAMVVLILLVVAAAASVIPAWRAGRVDPNVALRAD